MDNNKTNIMGLIGKHNYQEFIVDYFDHRLTNQQIEELWAFLRSNSEYEEEFYLYQDSIGSEDRLTIACCLNSNDSSKMNKDVLKKSLNDISEINEVNFDEFCIASLEGDLSSKDQVRLKQYIKNNPQKGQEIALIRKTFLVADKQIKYPINLKRDLKQAYSIPSRNRISYTAVAIAAVFIAGILVLRPFMSESLQDTSIVSQDNTIQKPEKPQAISEQTVKNTQGITAASKNTNKSQPKENPSTNEVDNAGGNPPSVSGQDVPLEYLSGLEASSIPLDSGTDSLIIRPNDTEPALENNNLLSIIPVDRSILENLNNQLPEIDSVNSYLNETTVLSAAKFTVDNVSKVLGKDKRLEYKVNQDGKLIAFGYGNLGYSTTRGQK